MARIYTFKNIYIYIYTVVQKFGISKIFNVFIKSLFCSSRLYLFDQKYRKKQEYCEILLQFLILISKLIYFKIKCISVTQH